MSQKIVHITAALDKYAFSDDLDEVDKAAEVCRDVLRLAIDEVSKEGTPTDNSHRDKLNESSGQSLSRKTSSLPDFSFASINPVRGYTASPVTKSASITIDTAPFPKDVAQAYSLMIIVRVADDSVDALTDPLIAKSRLFAITGEVRTIQINLSDAFIERANAADKRFHTVGIQFYITLIPKHIRAEQILTLADVTTLGGKQLKATIPTKS